MNPVDGRHIINQYTKNRMSTRPEFYSGRGAILSDLSSPLLEMIYQGLRHEAGVDAAAAFVQFVYDMEKLSATAFLNAFYEFCRDGCQWKPRHHRRSDDHDIGNDPQTQEACAFGSLAGALFGDDRRDETEAIRGSFLRDHESEYKPDKKRMQKRVSVFGFDY